jgi:hypothetical protein
MILGKIRLTSNESRERTKAELKVTVRTACMYVSLILDDAVIFGDQ